jgi:hypothetical protein
MQNPLNELFVETKKAPKLNESSGAKKILFNPKTFKIKENLTAFLLSFYNHFFT